MFEKFIRNQKLISSWDEYEEEEEEDSDANDSSDNNQKKL
jgi:hypothetical protein